MALRWRRQMRTKYEDLPEEEKKSDREEADKMIAIFGMQFARGILKDLSDDQRLEVFSGFCKECGCDDPKGRCQCWNDE